MRDDHDWDIELGTVSGQSCTPVILEWLLKTLHSKLQQLQHPNGGNIRIGANQYFTGDPSIAAHRQRYGNNFNSVQIEFAHWLRQDYQKEIIEVLGEIVNHFNRQALS